MRARLASLAAVVLLSVSAFAQTTNCPSQPPSLISPQNGATNIASPVAFDWTDIAGATGYALHASFGGGTPNIIALTHDSEYTVDVPPGTVEWWVDAVSGTCPITTSAHFFFTAVGTTASCPANPAAPSLIAPTNGAASLSSPVTLSWTSVAGSSGYRIYVQVGTQPAVIFGETTFTQVAAPFPAGFVTWFVEALFPNCPSTFSRTSTFAVSKGTACSSTPATLTSPANGGTVNSPVVFQWSAVPGAVGYKLYLSSGTPASDLSGITTDTTLTRIVGDGTFSWRVDTMFAGCPDVPSAQFTFTVPPTNACTGVTTLQAPAQNANVTSPVTLTWTAIVGANAYRIWGSINGGTPVLLGRSTGTSQKLSLPSGAIEWWIEALFDQCPSILSPHGNFTVTRATNCGSNPAPVLVSPVNGAQAQTTVTLNWNAASGALFYRVWISANGEPFEDIGVTTATTFTATNVDPGSVQWYVEAFFSGCDPVASTRATFTIPQPPRCADGTTLLISPANGAANQTAPVTLVWSAVPSATEYRVFAKINGSGKLILDRTAGTSSTKTLVPGNTEWWVESDFDGCPGTLSTHSTFIIPQSNNCGTDVPQIVAPANGATNIASPVTFDWNPLSGAVAYVVWMRHNGGAPTKIGSTSATDLVRRVPEGTIEWWVVTFFASCPPMSSAHATFTTATSTCANRPPILMAPINGATDLVSPVHLSWSAVPQATSYKVWAATDGQDASVVAATKLNALIARLPAGQITWFVEADFASCPATNSATATFSVLKAAPPCDIPDRPAASAPAQVASGTPFTIHWTPIANVTNYELQEATSATFSGATTQVVGDVFVTLTHTTGAQPARYYYRVRADSNCSDDHGAYSKTVSVLILPQAANAARHTTIDVGTQTGATQQITLPGQNPPVTFSAHGDKPWISVSPASGTDGPQGATLTVTFDPAGLKLGTNTGTIIVTYGTSGKIATNGVTPVVPVSVSLVTPVTPQGNNTPPPDSLIIPAIGHAPGANSSMFESDIRVANVSAQPMTYQLNFTLTQTDGTLSGQSETISVDPGATMALDDIVSNFFGIGGDGGAATGMLEIRPMTSATSNGFTTTPSVQTVASSRTFDSTPNGTFGQFIPAIPFSQFVGQSSRISLQQVSQSAAFRTNLGLVEASGQPATVTVHVYDNNGNQLAQIPESLLAGEHMQLNNFLQTNNIALTDGRLEVEVTSATGKVSAYASVVDNVTNDPLVVFPVTLGTVSATRYVVPGVADLSTGLASWRTDMRLFNSGNAPLTATLTYSPQPGNAGAANSVSIPIQPGQVFAANSALQSMFSLTNSGGSILVTTPSNSGLVVTARTYNQTSNGTYGQFIPAVTPADSIGTSDPSLQILQLEDSSRYRTNIGLAETSGKPATAQVSLILPDSKFAINVQVPLNANQFVQLPLSGFGAGTVYNGRVTVSVLSGGGTLTAYGSVIDQTTQDPTYVPAQ